MTIGANVSQWVNNREGVWKKKKKEKKKGTIRELSHNPDRKSGGVWGRGTARDRDWVTGMNRARRSGRKQERADRGQVCREEEDKLGDTDRANGTEPAAQLHSASFQSKVKIIATPLKRRLLYVFSVLLKEHNFILHQTVMEIWGELTWNKGKKRTRKQQKGLFFLYLKTLELEERELQTYSLREN